MIQEQARIDSRTMLKNSPYEGLVDVLRSEIIEYGGLLNLLDEQIDRIVHHDVNGLLEVKLKIDEQISVNKILGNERQAIVNEIAQEIELKVEDSMKVLLPYLPKNIRGLIEALMHEVVTLVEKTQRKAKQCQLMLARVCEVAEDVIRVFQPHRLMKTYNRKGALSLKIGDSITKMKTSA